MSNALSFTNYNAAPSAPRDSQTSRVSPPAAPPSGTILALRAPILPLPKKAPPVPRTMPERMNAARDRIRAAAEAGERIRSYEVALDLDMSEFHFARQFRAAFNSSPHVFYDEIRAARARALLSDGMSEGDVARKVGLRRPAELRALLAKRQEEEAAE